MACGVTEIDMKLLYLLLYHCLHDHILYPPFQVAMDYRVESLIPPCLSH